MMTENSVAIIGMACQLPGAENYDQFWNNLKVGIDATRSYTYAHINLTDFASEQDFDTTIQLGSINNKDKFDCHFFNISPKEAKYIDPQQRLLLQKSWHCIEDAGIPLEHLQNHRTSVYIGAMTQDYYERILKNTNHIEKSLFIGNSSSLLANRISYHLNLTGESITIATACSSSLVAHHKAMEAIKHGECDYALVGGVNLICNAVKHRAFDKSHMLSKKGKISTFCQHADGYVPGEGVGLVLLTSLKMAKELGHNIRAICCASHVNHNGKVSGITVPDVQSQVNLLSETLKKANLNSSALSYIEAHGSGTTLGDPIEVEALRKVFKNPCYIGSVKPNIGHLEGASGIAGLIKIVLMMRHCEIPPQINITKINPLLRIKQTQLKISQVPVPWKKLSNRIRYAGVSSLGFGGVNAHVILRENTEQFEVGDSKPVSHSVLPFLISAHVPDALRIVASSWQTHLQSGLSFEQVCAQSLLSATHLTYRVGTAVKNLQDIDDFLTNLRIDLGQKKSTQLLIKITGDEVEVDDLYESDWYKNTYTDSQIKNVFHLDAWDKFIGFEYFLNQLLKGLQVDTRDKKIIFSATGLSELALLKVAGYISLDEVIKAIKSKNTKVELKFNKANATVYIWSSTVEKILTCSFIDAQYLNAVIAADYDWNKINERISYAKDIYTFQHTFKNIINHYQQTYNSLKGPLPQASDLFNVFDDVKTSQTVKVISLFLIETALYRLYKKWNLQDELFNEYPDYFKTLVKKCYASDISEILKYFASGEGVFADPFYHGIPSLESNLEDAVSYIFDKSKNHRSKMPILDQYEVIEINASRLSIYGSLLKLWQKGCTIDWAGIIPSLSHCNKPLPLYPFSLKRIWLDNDFGKKIIKHHSSQANSHDFLLNASLLGDLALGHNIENRRIVPAALITTLFLFCFKTVSQQDIKLENIIFISMLHPQEHSQLSIIIEESSPHFFQLRLVAAEGQTYATAKINSNVKPQQTNEIIPVNRSKKTLHKEEIYSILARYQLNYEGSYARISTLEIGFNYLMAYLEPDPERAPLAMDFCGIDAAFQASYFLDLQNEILKVPFYIENLCIHSIGVISKVLIKKKSNSFDCNLYDSEARLCVSIHGYYKSQMKRILDVSQEAEYSILTPVWREMAVKQPIVISERVGLIFEKPNHLSNQIQEIYPQFTTLSRNKCNSLTELDVIYYFCGIGAGIDDDERGLCYRKTNQAALNLFEFFKHVISLRERGEIFKVVIVTEGIFSITNEDLINPTTATFIGLMRSLQKEIKNWIICTVDLENCKPEFNKHELIKLFELSPKKSSAFVLRNQTLFEQKWRIIKKPSLLQNTAKFGKNILIIGGTGGIGQHLTALISSTEHANIILIGRSNYQENFELKRLEKISESTIHNYSCDITNENQLKDTLNQIEVVHGRIETVFHLALKLQDSLLNEMSADDFLQVLAVKTACILVHRYLKGPSQAIFFSTFLGYQAYAGQCNYLAGSTFQDSFIHWLKQEKNCIGTAINWGFWGTTGAVATPEYRKKFSKLGYASILPEEALPIGLSLINTVPQYIILKHQLPIDKLLVDLKFDNNTSTNIKVMKETIFKIEAQFISDLLRLFQSANLFIDKMPMDTQSIRQKLMIIPKYYNYLDNLLKHLEDWEIIEHQPRGWSLKDDNVTDSVICHYSYEDQYQGYVTLYNTALTHCLEIIQGNELATDVFFPSGKTDLLEGFYTKFPVSKYYNQILSSELSQVIPKLQSKELNILELGAGTGASSEYIVNALVDSGFNVKYYYTDLSKYFLDIGKEKLGKFNFVEFHILDINSVNKSILSNYQFDVILATNVIHATANIFLTLKNIRALLKPSGYLLLNELTNRSLFLDLIFGLFDGWWLSSDDDIRLHNSPLLTEDSWKSCLEKVKFDIFSANEVPTAGIIDKMGSSVIVAQKRDINIEKCMDNFLISCIGDLLEIDPKLINASQALSEFGIDSIVGIDLINKINKHYQLSLPTITLFEYPTVESLYKYIKSQISADAPPEIPTSCQTVKDACINSWQLTQPVEGVQITLSEVNIGQPLDHEVQIKVVASGINFADLLCMSGVYPTMPSYPFIPGLEISGVVQATGAHVDSFKSGDKVFGLTGPRMGGHAQLVNVNQQLLLKLPESLTYEQAASLPIVYISVAHIFSLINPMPGQSILIQSAAGGLGTMLIQFAKLHGLDIYATVGSESKFEWIQALGVDKIFNYRKETFLAEALAITNKKGFEIVINTLGGKNMQDSLALVAPFGKYVETAMSGMLQSTAVNFNALNNNQTYFSVDVRRMTLEYPWKTESYLKQLNSDLESKNFFPLPQKQYLFEKLDDALADLSSRKNVGKIVLTHREAQDFPEQLNPIEKDYDEVAIISMSGVFSDADDPDIFFANICQGKTAVKKHDNEKEVYPWGARLNLPLDFDSKFFGISEREAQCIDPQQKLFLSVCYQALNQVGFANGASSLKCGVYAGFAYSDFRENLAGHPAKDEPQIFWGSSDAVIASRVSYFLNLKGPAITINTACSSSLVAIHLARQALLNGDVDMALAGGVFIQSLCFNAMADKAGMLSENGILSPFDQDANGFVPGDAGAVICMKKLSQAKADGDIILGVIKATAINQDGRTNGITAPNPSAQVELIKTCMNEHHIDINAIDYIEAHGTGTYLGDPIEYQALYSQFQKRQPNTKPCYLGSVKANVGHTAAAAGVVGIIKLLQIFRYNKIPPQINFQSPNSNLKFDTQVFDINKHLVDLSAPLSLGTVSSFGFSGTNAFAVIQNYPDNRKLCSTLSDVALSPIWGKKKKHLDSGGVQLKFDGCNLLLANNHHVFGYKVNPLDFYIEAIYSHIQNEFKTDRILLSDIQLHKPLAPKAGDEIQLLLQEHEEGIELRIEASGSLPKLVLNAQIYELPSPIQFVESGVLGVFNLLSNDETAMLEGFINVSYSDQVVNLGELYHCTKGYLEYGNGLICKLELPNMALKFKRYFLSAPMVIDNIIYLAYLFNKKIFIENCMGITEVAPLAFIPQQIRQLRIFRPLTENTYGLCLRASNDLENDLSFNAQVFKSNGEVVLEFINLKMASINKLSLTSLVENI